MIINKRFILWFFTFFLFRNALRGEGIFPIYSSSSARIEGMGGAGSHFYKNLLNSEKIYFANEEVSLSSFLKYHFRSFKFSVNSTLEFDFSNKHPISFEKNINKFLGSKSYNFFILNEIKFDNSNLEIGISKIQYFKEFDKFNHQLLGQMQFYIKGYFPLGNKKFKILTVPTFNRYRDEESKILELNDIYQIQERSYTKIALGFDNYLIFNILGGFLSLGFNNFPTFYFSYQTENGFVLPNLKLSFKKSFYFSSNVIKKYNLILEMDNLLSNDLYRNYYYETNLLKKLHFGNEISIFDLKYFSLKVRGGFSHFYPTFGLSLYFNKYLSLSYAFFNKDIGSKKNLFFHSFECSLGL